VFAGKPVLVNRARKNGTLNDRAAERAAKRAKKNLDSQELFDSLESPLDRNHTPEGPEGKPLEVIELDKVTLLAPKLAPLVAERIRDALSDKAIDLRVIFNQEVQRFEVYAVVSARPDSLRHEITVEAKKHSGDWPVYVRLITRSPHPAETTTKRSYTEADLKETLEFRERNKPLTNLKALSDQIDRDLPIGCYLLRLHPFECQLEDGPFRGVMLKAYVPAEKKSSFLAWWKRAEEKFNCRILPQISWASEDFNKFLAYVAGKSNFLDASHAQSFRERLQDLAEPAPRWDLEMPAPSQMPALRDLRDLPFVTIDPDGTEDMEDALFAERLENGNIRLLVSVVDVSWYCPIDSPLFSKVQRRGFSVYGRDAAYPLLGQTFGFGLGSFHEAQDRLAWTVELEVSPSGGVLDSSVYRSFVRSRAKLTPESAALRAEDPNLPLTELRDVASWLRARRAGRDATHASSTSRFDLVVEGCMVGANTALADMIKENGRDGVFITFATPSAAKKLEMACTLRELEHPGFDRLQVDADDFDRGIDFERVWLKLRDRGECTALHDVAHTLFPASRASVEPYSHRGIPAQQYARLKGNTSIGILLQHLVKAMVDEEPQPISLDGIRKMVRTFNRQARAADACSAQAGLSQMLARNLPLCGSVFKASIAKVLDDGTGYHLDLGDDRFKKFVFMPKSKLPDALVGQGIKVSLDRFSLTVNRFEVSPL